MIDRLSETSFFLEEETDLESLNDTLTTGKVQEYCVPFTVIFCLWCSNRLRKVFSQFSCGQWRFGGGSQKQICRTLEKLIKFYITLSAVCLPYCLAYGRIQ